MDGRKWTANTPENVDGFAIHMARSYQAKKVDVQNVDARQVRLQMRTRVNHTSPSEEHFLLHHKDCQQPTPMVPSARRRDKKKQEQWRRLIELANDKDDDDFHRLLMTHTLMLTASLASYASTLTGETGNLLLQRVPKFVQEDQVCWERHVQDLLAEGESGFTRYYRMSLEWLASFPY